MGLVEMLLRGNVRTAMLLTCLAWSASFASADVPRPFRGECELTYEIQSETLSSPKTKHNATLVIRSSNGALLYDYKQSDGTGFTSVICDGLTYIKENSQQADVYAGICPEVLPLRIYFPLQSQSAKFVLTIEQVPELLTHAKQKMRKRLGEDWNVGVLVTERQGLALYAGGFLTEESDAQGKTICMRVNAPFRSEIVWSHFQTVGANEVPRRIEVVTYNLVADPTMEVPKPECHYIFNLRASAAVLTEANRPQVANVLTEGMTVTYTGTKESATISYSKSRGTFEEQVQSQLDISNHSEGKILVTGPVNRPKLPAPRPEPFPWTAVFLFAGGVSGGIALWLRGKQPK